MRRIRIFSVGKMTSSSTLVLAIDVSHPSREERMQALARAGASAVQAKAANRLVLLLIYQGIVNRTLVHEPIKGLQAQVNVEAEIRSVRCLPSKLEVQA